MYNTVVWFQGALVTCCSDDNVHLWNYRQKRPEIVHSLKFTRERLALYFALLALNFISEMY